MDNIYKFLNLDENVEFAELESAFNAKRAELKELTYKVGAEGNDAARAIADLDEAFSLARARHIEQSGLENGTRFAPVHRAIASGDFNGAQEMLDTMSGRDAEWHYWQSALFYKKHWYLESKKQIKMALAIEPSNKKYIQAHNILVEEAATRDFAAQINNIEESNELRGCLCGDCIASCCCL